MFDGKLDKSKIQQVCGALVHGKPLDKEINPSYWVKPIQERRVHLMKIPNEPIFKMCKSVYVDNFFEQGKLQLGSFNYYNSFDHDEIGDKTEGEVVLIAQDKKGTACGKFGGGYNSLVFCAYAGKPEQSTLNKFGYDSGFKIIDPEKFAEAIHASVASISYEYAMCNYSKHKAIMGYPKNGINRQTISSETIKMVNSAQYYIKPDRYSHQKEFRFLWDTGRECLLPIVIECPEATKYCERI